MPKFSVVIPTYNQCNYLAKAIKSVINQSINDVEIIIIDNFSNDKTKMSDKDSFVYGVLSSLRQKIDSTSKK